MRLTFGSYNIRHGEDAALDMSKIAETITKPGMDIVGIQEIDQMTSRVGGIDTMKMLSNATGYPYYVFFKAISYKGGEYGIGILSKYPILETDRIELGSGECEQRVLGKAVIEVAGIRIPFFVTHLSYESKPLRTAQFAQVATVLANYKNFVLAGDFNTFDFSEYAEIPNAEALNTANRYVITFPENASSIDNILFGRGAWCFEAPQTVTESYSDHYALYTQATYVDSLL